MKKLLLVFCLLLLPPSLLPFIVNAGDEYPPKMSGASEAGGYVEPYTIEEGAFDDILKVKKKEFVDNWGIHYCLAIAKGKITGTANGAQSCGYTGAFDVSGSYKGKNYTFTVTNPTSCDLQYYIVKGVADKKFKRAKTGTGTYDWNGDGVDGSLNFTYEGPCGN